MGWINIKITTFNSQPTLYQTNTPLKNNPTSHPTPPCQILNLTLKVADVAAVKVWSPQRRFPRALSPGIGFLIYFLWGAIRNSITSTFGVTAQHPVDRWDTLMSHVNSNMLKGPSCFTCHRKCQIGQLPDKDSLEREGVNDIILYSIHLSKQ